MRDDSTDAGDDREDRAVTALYDSEGWEKRIETRSRFHKYPYGNTLLIAMQRLSDASHITGFRGWQRLDRQVRKGEEAIWIWPPYRPVA